MEQSILIVDDDAGDRRHVIRALKQACFAGAYVEAADVASAVAACDKSIFDFAILDYQMPGNDGLQGIAALRERFPYLPLIMATSHGDEMIATEAMKLGAADYIPKSQINKSSIRRAVDSAIEKTALRRKVALHHEELASFASVLAHDLSAPIASIQMFARAIEEDLRLETADRDEINNNCRELLDAAVRAGALIDTLFEYAKPDGHVVFEPIAMELVLESAVANLRQIVQKRGAQVTHDELPLVTGNAPQLIQLVQNFIGNAIKYCESDIPRIHVGVKHDKNDSWQFALKDNGIGIPAQHFRNVFEPFKRLHVGTKYPGTGLGLATCEKIVNRHGGVVWCDSAPGMGSTFFFTLPGAPK